MIIMILLVILLIILIIVVIVIVLTPFVRDRSATGAGSRLVSGLGLHTLSAIDKQTVSKPAITL